MDILISSYQQCNSADIQTPQFRNPTGTEILPTQSRTIYKESTYGEE